MNPSISRLLEKADLVDLAKEIGYKPKSQLDCYLDQFITQDPQLLMIKDQIKILAPSNIPVLLRGDCGTGKELLARALHDNKEGEFVAINASAIPGELLENELFGSAKGSYTSSNKDKPGLLEEVHKGTLFLDEIGDMPLLLQCKLLRVLEDKKFRRIGSKEEIPVDFRLVTATNQSIEKLRKDLYYRIAGFEIKIPSLCSRHHRDITLLVTHFLEDCSEELIKSLLSELEQKINLDQLPGNVRQLKNICARTKLFNKPMI